MKTIEIPDAYYELFLSILDKGLATFEPANGEELDKMETEVYNFFFYRKWEKPFDEDFEKFVKESYKDKKEDDVYRIIG